MTVFAHVTIIDPALDQPTQRSAGINPASCIGWMRQPNGQTRVLLLGGQYLDLTMSPEDFEEACRTAGLVPA